MWVDSVFNLSNVILIIFTLIVLCVYQLVLKYWWYFSNRNVKFVRGWPIVGSLYKFFFGQISFAEAVDCLYRKFQHEHFFGIYELTHPIYVIRDPDLVKKVTTQDFEHFLNHQTNFDVELDSLLGRSLFFSHDQRWKEMRSILSASFTGNKMRMMFDLVSDCTKKFVNTIKNQANNENGVEVELKDLFSRYTTNVIATTAFGLDVDAVSDRDNAFYLAGKQITNFDGIQGLKLLLLDVVPTIMKFFRIHFLNVKLCDYFRKVVLSAMAYREKNNIFRPDMIHLMMQARKGTLQNEDDECKTDATAKKTSKFH